MAEINSYKDIERLFGGKITYSVDSHTMVNIVGHGTTRTLYVTTLYLQELVPLCNALPDNTITFTATSFEFDCTTRFLKGLLFKFGLTYERKGPTQVLLTTFEGHDHAEYYQGLKYDLANKRFINRLPPLLNTTNKHMLQQYRTDCDTYALKLSAYLRLTNSSGPSVISFSGEDIKTGAVPANCCGVLTAAKIKSYMRYNATILKRQYGVFDGRN